MCQLPAGMGLLQMSEVKMRSCWSRVGFESNVTGVCVRRERFGQRHKGKRAM